MTVKQAEKKAPAMTLKDVIRGKSYNPDRVLLYGVSGVGKTTFAASIPGALVIDYERGAGATGAARIEPGHYDEFIDTLRELAGTEHPFKTVVVDSVSVLEMSIWNHLCRQHSWKSIESPGYGKGYAAAAEELRSLLIKLDWLVQKRGIQVVFVGHAHVKTFNNPAGADYCRYELRAQKQFAALLMEWCDSVLFAHYEEWVDVDTSRSHGKGIATGSRVIHSVRMPAWEAKCRWGIPEQLPLEWTAYEDARKAAQEG